MDKTERNWFALYTKPRSEFKAAEELGKKSLEFFLPARETIKQWSDRKKKVMAPLFPGYIFVKANEKERFYSMQCSSIIRTICFSGQPSKIPETQIESLKKLMLSPEKIEVRPQISRGTRVLVTEGPLQGVTGIVFSSDNQESMIAVTVDLLKRSVIVHLPINSVTREVNE